MQAIKGVHVHIKQAPVPISENFACLIIKRFSTCCTGVVGEETNLCHPWESNSALDH